MITNLHNWCKNHKIISSLLLVSLSILLPTAYYGHAYEWLHFTMIP